MFFPLPANRERQALRFVHVGRPAVIRDSVKQIQRRAFDFAAPERAIGRQNRTRQALKEQRFDLDVNP